MAEYKSIDEVRQALYPRMVPLLELDPGEYVEWDEALNDGKPQS